MTSTERKRKKQKIKGEKQRGKEAKRQRIKQLFFLCFFASLLLCFSTIGSPVIAQESGAKQFQQNFSIRGGINGTLIIVGLSSDAANIQKLADMVIAEAQRTYDLLDASNPSSEVSMLNSGAGQGKKKVSWQVADAFAAAKKAAQWSKGAFDIVTVGGDYNSINVNEKDSTVELKKAGMEVRFDSIVNGYLADYMVGLVYQANMQNTMVRVGNVFRGLGNSLYGPWKIQVQEDSTAYARHALDVTVTNTGIATISATDFHSKPLIDYRSKNPVTPKSKGATIVMNEAALAQGIAYAVFVVGPEDGMNLLAKSGGRGLIVDAQGKFLKTPGL